MKISWVRVFAALIGLVLWVGASQAYSAEYEEVIYYHNDALGSPILATDQNGDVLWREEYSPYGSRLTHEARETDCSVGPCVQIESLWDEKNWYTGKFEETRLSLNYFGARWYDPELGRFISQDPVGFDQNNIFSFNRYVYANNNPYKYVDPDGKQSREAAYEMIGMPDPSGAAIKRAAQLGSVANSSANVADNVASDPLSWVPGALGLKTFAAGVLGIKAVKTAKAGKRYSDEKQALVDMAKQDKKKGGITSGDMQAYKDLNRELPDPFPSTKVRGPEAHSNRSHGKEPHGHVGPVNHIPVKDKQ